MKLFTLFYDDMKYIKFLSNPIKSSAAALLLAAFSLCFSSARAENSSLAPKDSSRVSFNEKSSVTTSYTQFKFQFKAADFIKHSFPESAQIQAAAAKTSQLSKDYFTQFVQSYQDLYGKNQLATAMGAWMTNSASTDEEALAVLEQHFEAMLQRCKTIMTDRLSALGGIVSSYEIEKDTLELGTFSIKIHDAQKMLHLTWFLKTQGKLQFWESYPAQELPKAFYKKIKSGIKLNKGDDTGSCVLGNVPQKKKYKMRDLLEAGEKLLPEEVKILWDKNDIYGSGKNTAGNFLYSVKTETGQPALSGNIIERAVVKESAGEPQVIIQLTSAAREKFAQLSGSHVGQPLVISIDGEVLSAPTVHAAITSGHCQLPANISPEGAKQLTAILNQPPYEIPCQFKALVLHSSTKTVQ